MSSIEFMNFFYTDSQNIPQPKFIFSEMKCFNKAGKNEEERNSLRPPHRRKMIDTPSIPSHFQSCWYEMQILKGIAPSAALAMIQYVVSLMFFLQ